MTVRSTRRECPSCAYSGTSARGLANHERTHHFDYEASRVRRFWKYVSKTNACWLWTSASDGSYGALSTRHGQGPAKAHIVSWVLHYGPVPAGLEVLHKCDVRLCVRPDHLFLGTQKDNVRDASAKGRLSPISLLNLRPGRPGHLGASKEPVNG